jgi:hypothetical protein
MILNDGIVDKLEHGKILKTAQHDYSSSSGTVVATTNLAYAKSLDLPFKLQSEHPVFDLDNNSKWNDGEIGFRIKDEYHSAIGKKKRESFDSPSYKEWNDKMVKLSSFHYLSPEFKDNPKLEEDFKGYRAMRSYTGTTYKTINPNLRSVLSVKSGMNFSLDSSARTLIEFFLNNSFELETGIWVYRNAKIPDQSKYKPGDVFLDPAFISTSLASTVSMGYKENSARLKIFLPKGTKCLPVLDHSSHRDEMEIILAPFSRINITEVYKKTNYQGKITRSLMVGAYTGNGLNSFYDAVKNSKVSELLEEKKNSTQVKSQNKKDGKKDSKHAWEDETLSYEDMQKLSNKISTKKTKMKY